jgi:hypothetical protein
MYLHRETVGKETEEPAKGDARQIYPELFQMIMYVRNVLSD